MVGKILHLLLWVPHDQNYLFLHQVRIFQVVDMFCGVRAGFRIQLYNFHVGLSALDIGVLHMVQIGFPSIHRLFITIVLISLRMILEYVLRYGFARCNTRPRAYESMRFINGGLIPIRL